ncbi:MAG: ATP synthase F1 subunit delta [Vulcanimicrobiota bacterium]
MVNAIGVRYAQALFDMARAKNQLDAQLADLVKVQLIFRDHEQLTRALQAPTIPSPVKKSILQKVLSGRVTDTTLHFFYVLVDKGREIYVDSVVESYRELLRQSRDEVKVIVQSADKLDDNLIKQVEASMKSYTGKKVELEFEVVPELLGGLLFRIGDRIIDGSIRHQLNQIHERLSKAGAAAVGG